MSLPATFDYTTQIGTDQQILPGETSSSRRLQFNDTTGEMFQFTVIVKGYFPDSAGASAGAAGSSSGGAAGGTSSGGSTTGGTSSGSGTSPGSVLQACPYALWLTL